jgi:hypothetical protein
MAASLGCYSLHLQDILSSTISVFTAGVSFTVVVTTSPNRGGKAFIG